MRRLYGESHYANGTTEPRKLVSISFPKGQGQRGWKRGSGGTRRREPLSENAPKNALLIISPKGEADLAKKSFSDTRTALPRSLRRLQITFTLLISCPTGNNLAGLASIAGSAGLAGFLDRVLCTALQDSVLETPFRNFTEWNYRTPEIRSPCLTTQSCGN